MPLNVIQLFTPFFFVLIAVELLVLWRMQRLRYYRLNDSLADMSCGVLSQLSGAFFKVLTLAAFAYVNLNWSLQSFFPAIPSLPDGNPFGGVGWQWHLLSWTLTFLAVDFAYYWAHRHCHEVAFLWATHVVHHSSEEYNLSVALRQSSLQGLFTTIYFLPLAFLGVTWQMFTVSYGLNLIYQFWIHTRAIGRLHPWAEYILNTPSHHRVHHGVNPEYQDKNYAGMFIIWDRLFGTFALERAAVVYGITVPFRSWNPLWANIHVWQGLWRDARQTRRWQDKLRLFFAKPGWKPADLGPSIAPVPVSVESYRKYDHAISRSSLAYSTLHFVVASLIGVAILELAATVPLQWLLGPAFYVALTLTNLGGVLEAKRWAYVAEWLRHGSTLLLTAAVAYLWPNMSRWAAVGAVGYALLSAGWLYTLRRELHRRTDAPDEEQPGLAAAASA